MAEITRRFIVTATKHHQSQIKIETIVLGKAVEWDGKDIVLELDAVPVGSWWSGVIAIKPEGAEVAISPNLAGKFDVVAARRAEGPERRTRWMTVGTAMGFESGHLTADLQQLPAGSWWDGKLRLFHSKDHDRNATKPTGTR